MSLLKSILKTIFNSGSESKIQKPAAALPVKTRQPEPKPIEEWENYDKAAQHFFDILGEPTQHIASNRAYKTWAVEFEISEALEKIENDEFPPEIAEMFQDMIAAFQEVLEGENTQDFRGKSNYFTIGYGFGQYEENRGYQDHSLSIGCPIGTLGAPRFKTSMTKFSYNTRDLGDHGGVWINKVIEDDHMIMNLPAPKPFYLVGLNFFRYLETAYNPEKSLDSAQSFAIGGAYGPSGTLG